MYSLWLTFSAADQKRLQQAVSCLAQATGAPVFAPHITLVGEIDRPLEDISRACEEICASLGAGGVTITSLGRGDSYFMALYLNATLPAVLQHARSELAERLLDDSNRIDPAHISLAYGGDALATLALADTVSQEFIGGPLQAERIEIVRSSRDIPVKDWRRVASFDLSAAVFG
ncbi:2'-5' RNA ligase family protein [Candidatus Halocynthiibacter alkanivorans]|uniref:2'-5' RNA ligase family protein n=1 Tax=Candidatus Halocynthiibacter alkanivorans TaxID=2267619 RepID=UPI000DF44787|nr:2'-5' RNA ligase family protein [Candidatus Halocynthiibacter alkanivorans]